jgi:amino acid adenylation domain-containing protein
MLPARTIQETFYDVVKRTPESIAIAGDADPLSFADLARRSDLVARYLLARGIGLGAKVGVFAERSADAVAAMLGILKAGAAFVPFDPSYPHNLLRFIYQDCSPALLFVQASLLERLGHAPFWQGETIDISNDFKHLNLIDRPAPEVDGDTPAYVMYTSGSTGHPKGVIVPHRGVVRLVVDNPFAVMDASQVHLQMAPLAFDASTFEIWGALLNGATLAICANPYPTLDDIADAIRRHRVTTLWLTAGLFHLMVEHRLDGLKPLRQLLAGGDVLSPPHVVKALRALPECQLINGYGPTENTTFTCCYRIPRDHSDTAPIPIGSPIAHTTVYVLDESGCQVADGRDGELYTGGLGVALGYLNRPELTAERFLTDPFQGDGSRSMYRTGDRVRRRPDGNLEFLGRIDRQVKINGKRVELDEIEACLRRSGIIDDAAVISPYTPQGTRKLFAYIKSTRDHGTLLRELRAFLKQELPDYMMPASFSVLAALPLSPTGKVDRSKLPAIASPGEAVGQTAIVPAKDSSIEDQLGDIWCVVLGRGTVDTEDNFFDLGGTSLQIMQAHAMIQEMIQANVTIVDLFQYPRISALAAALRARSASKPVPASGAMSAQDRARRQQSSLARARAASGRHAS